MPKRFVAVVLAVDSDCRAPFAEIVGQQRPLRAARLGEAEQLRQIPLRADLHAEDLVLGEQDALQRHLLTCRPER